MSELRLQMNEYLALEFSTDGTPSENVPFALTLAHQDSDLVIFEFDEDEPFFAIFIKRLPRIHAQIGLPVPTHFEAWLPNSLDSLMFANEPASSPTNHQVVMAASLRSCVLALISGDWRPASRAPIVPEGLPASVEGTKVPVWRKSPRHPVGAKSTANWTLRNGHLVQ